MARIDLYLNGVVRFGATGAVMVSGSNVKLCFPTGDRPSVQATSHDQLVAIIEEIAGEDALADLMIGNETKFSYKFQARVFEFHVAPSRNTWRVTIGNDKDGSASQPEAESEIAIAHHTRELAKAEPLAIAALELPASAPPLVLDVAAITAPPIARTAAPPATPLPPAFVEPELTSGPELLRIEKLMMEMLRLKASDLHLASGSPPMIRADGAIKIIEGHPPFTPESLIEQLYEVTPDKNRREFEERNDTDFAHSIPGVSRFRANLFRDRKGPGAVFRAIPFTILPPEKLGLPKGVLDLCFLTKGLVVVTGPTGSGKSTTLATLVDHINMNRHDHIITIEDPIEFVHENKGCLVNQREVHTHTKGFKDALRAALREDPDIVLVGEMRDLETIAIAVETAETGHLVFGTLHTTTAPSTIDRIIDQFPADRQDQIRQMLAESLKGVIAQTLCKKIGGGRVAAYEVLMGSSAVSNLIREAKTYQLFSLMQTGRNQGMITLNDSLMELVRKKQVEPMEAYMKSVSKAELKGMLTKDGFSLPESS